MSVVNTNLTALKGQGSLSRTQGQLTTAMERLSSGMRVNGAKDDAAGQAIGNRLQAQTTGLGQAARNASDGISLSQTAQGVLDGINDKLQRIRELTVQGLNGTLSTRDSDAIQAEINQNLQEIDRLAASAEYNGIPLMTGQAGMVDLQVGASDGQTLGIDLKPPGFSTQALGLEGLNIAGVDGEVAGRNTLRGQAQHIPLYDPATDLLPFSPGSELPLYFASGFGYYTSDQAGGFAQVTVSASHETATDTSQVRVHSPRPIFTSELETQPEPIPPLPAGQRLVQADGVTYLEERLGDGSLSYRQAGVELSYQEDFEERTRWDGTTYEQRIYPASATLSPSAVAESGDYTELAESFIFDGQNYNLADAANTTFVRTGSGALADGRLVESVEGELYLASGTGEGERFYRLDSVQTWDRLLVNAESSPIVMAPDSDDGFSEVGGTFTFDGTTYTRSDFNQVVLSPDAATLVQSDKDGELFLRTGSSEGDYEYFALDKVSTERDLTLRAENQGFVGLDLADQATLVDPRTPSVDFTELDDVTFQGADFGGLSELTLVQRTTSDGQWVIRGVRGDGGLAYFDTDLDLEVDARGQPVAAVATATQAEPTILGVKSHERERVSGYSEITIDPRNVTVAYTDAKGQTFEDVLRESEDGNYYFALPGESSLLGGYKTATLVDLEGTSEVLLRTVNGGSEVVVYYPSNVSMGTNLSVVALTDADGFNDDGVPHTRLQIRETGEDFRLRVPRNPLAALDRAIGMVDAKRSHLGAVENRLASVMEGHESANISLSSARSRIMDADYAAETANMVKAQILQQAGNSMLAQANVMPEIVLSLLT